MKYSLIIVWKNWQLFFLAKKGGRVLHLSPEFLMFLFFKPSDSWQGKGKKFSTTNSRKNYTTKLLFKNCFVWKQQRRHGSGFRTFLGIPHSALSTEFTRIVFRNSGKTLLHCLIKSSLFFSKSSSFIKLNYFLLLFLKFCY